MKKRIATGVAVTVLLVAMTALTGCYRVDLSETGDTTIERVSLGSADEVVVNLDMGAGDLTIGSGSKQLMEGEFQFSDGRFEPEIDYDVKGAIGALDIKQPSINAFPGLQNYENTWDLRFADDVPMELDIDMGAGKVDLDLGELMLTDMTLKAGAGDMALDLSDGRVLRDLVVETGAGALSLDLSGEDWEQDIDARISAGAGDITIIVPENVGVRVVVEKGLGDVSARGMINEGADVYVNDAYRGGGVSLDIRVEAGVGQITVEMR